MNSKHFRVTEVLEPFVDFSMIPPQVLENASRRGNRVHDLCEDYVKTGETFCPVLSDKPYLESFMKWFDSRVEVYYFAEHRITSDSARLTGQIDLLVKMKGDAEGATLVDIKTCAQEAVSWKLQTAAYQWLCEEELKCVVIRRGSLLLNKNGGGPNFFEYDDYSYHWKVFKGLLETHMFFDHHEENPYRKKEEEGILNVS